HALPRRHEAAGDGEDRDAHHVGHIHQGGDFDIDHGLLLAAALRKASPRAAATRFAMTNMAKRLDQLPVKVTSAAARGGPAICPRLEPCTTRPLTVPSSAGDGATSGTAAKAVPGKIGRAHV